MPVKTVVCFGSSTVYGFGDRDQYGGWVGRLARDFLAPRNERRGGVAAFYNLGVLGDTAATLSARIEDELAVRCRPGGSMVCLVSIGMNDSRLHRDGTPSCTIDIFSQHLEDIIYKARQCCEDVLYIGFTGFDETKTQPFLGRDVMFTRAWSGTFEQAAIATCTKLGVASVPLFPLSSTEEFIRTMVDDDGLHPNNQGHQWVYEQVRLAAKQLWQ